MTLKRISAGRIFAGLLTAVYLKYLLLPTATLFFRLYHLTHIDPLYSLYAGFKAVGYYFGVWPYQLVTCIAIGALIALPWLSWARTLLSTAMVRDHRS